MFFRGEKPKDNNARFLVCQPRFPFNDKVHHGIVCKGVPMALPQEKDKSIIRESHACGENRVANRLGHLC